jgi:hypothetical protein
MNEMRALLRNFERRIRLLERKGHGRREASGTVTLSLSSETFKAGAVTFPTSRFSAAPTVLVSMASAPAGSQKLVPRAHTISSSGCTVAVYTGDQLAVSTTGLEVSWYAFQP